MVALTSSPERRPGQSRQRMSGDPPDGSCLVVGGSEEEQTHANEFYSMSTQLFTAILLICVKEGTQLLKGSASLGSLINRKKLGYNAH